MDGQAKTVIFNVSKIVPDVFILTKKHAHNAILTTTESSALLIADMGLL
jgi:hypothetical protein